MKPGEKLLVNPYYKTMNILYACSSTCSIKENDYNYCVIPTGELPAPTVPPFTQRSGAHVSLPRNATPLHYLELFLITTVWIYLVNQTNAYPHHRLSTTPPSRRSLFRNWIDITISQIKTFVGLVLNMGLVQFPEIKEYWSRHETLNIRFFRNVFIRDRFLHILGNLHVGEINGPTKRSKIQGLIDLVLNTPSQNLSIDEAMIGFRGGVSFRQ